ncbi:MAG: hypothetical protein KAW09_06220 [Thermoplasmata archaeon]|nr:hypothetical protein [Thermoplasmata archaeon]
MTEFGIKQGDNRKALHLHPRLAYNISDIDNRVAKKFQHFSHLPVANRVNWPRVY